MNNVTDGNKYYMYYQCRYENEKSSRNNKSSKKMINLAPFEGGSTLKTKKLSLFRKQETLKSNLKIWYAVFVVGEEKCYVQSEAMVSMSKLQLLLNLTLSTVMEYHISRNIY